MKKYRVKYYYLEAFIAKVVTETELNILRKDKSIDIISVKEVTNE